MKKIIAMIPARLGSKRVKKKNIRIINGKPLIQYVIETIKKSSRFDEIYLNSESKIFHKIAKKTHINFYKRDKKFSTDKSLNDEFALDFINNTDGHILIQVLPTSPLVLLEEINSFVDFFVDNNLDTLISVEDHKIACLYKNKPINFYKFKKNPPSQTIIPVKSYATVLMGWKYSTFKKNMKKFSSGYHGGHGKTDYFSLSPLSCIDIDNEVDFNLIERIILSKEIKIKKPGYFK